MDFLHHPWIFEHEKVKTEDDGLIDVDYRAERVKTNQDCLVRIPREEQDPHPILVHRS